MEPSGTYRRVTVAGEPSTAFVPDPLPPKHSLDMHSLYGLLDEANQAIGRLDGLSMVLPDPSLFIYFYVRKEALLSSQIEGTQSSLADLILFEAAEKPGVPLDDVEEVSNYVAAVNHGIERLRGGFPLSLRLIREIHAILLRGGRGAAKAPGDFRSSQNWIGGRRPSEAVFVPPPVEDMRAALANLETFLHDGRATYPLLVRAGLVHVQFETIHPFLDGNGRLGRLLITLLLHEERALDKPILYLSHYLKAHRAEYYELLTRVRTNGDWAAWLNFFLTGVRDVAGDAIRTAKRIQECIERDKAAIETLSGRAANVLRVFSHFQRHPISPISRAAEGTGLSVPTVTRAVQILIDLGVLGEIGARKRNRLFRYGRYLSILSEGAEPLSARA